MESRDQVTMGWLDDGCALYLTLGGGGWEGRKCDKVCGGGGDGDSGGQSYRK